MFDNLLVLLLYVIIFLCIIMLMCIIVLVCVCIYYMHSYIGANEMMYFGIKTYIIHSP